MVECLLRNVYILLMSVAGTLSVNIVFNTFDIVYTTYLLNIIQIFTEFSEI